MKTIKYIAPLFLTSLLCFGTSGCSEKEDLSAGSDDKGIEITGINLSMEGRTGEAETATRAAWIKGFSVNRAADPTAIGLNQRNSGWKIDFTLYYKKDQNTAEETYNAGSFAGVAYDGSTTFNPTSVATQRYFPNYTKQNAEAFLYPGSAANVAPDEDQSDATKLLAQDVLQKSKGKIDVAHTPSIVFSHKHAMLNFVIKDVVASDIAADGVKVTVAGKTYTPCKITALQATDLEYMVILPEDTKSTANNPVVEIKTNDGNHVSSITYKQTIRILRDEVATLGSNKCYCFTLQGAPLKISPITVVNWTTGVAIPGEYIAVTAYPTFKAESHPEQTYYFYYDNKLVDASGKAKLQVITFNKNGECTIKPDGRVLTHIFNSASATPDDANALTKSVLLDQMIIPLNTIISALK